MRRLTTLLSLIFAVSFINSEAQAEGLIYQLPADGVSVTYDVKLTVQGMAGTGTLKLSSVGKSVEDGKACRWLEVAFDMTIGERQRKIICKVLMPEEDLKAGKSPFDSQVRSWIRKGANSDPTELNQRDYGPIPAFFSKPLTDSKKLEAIEIETKALGKLKCKGESGKTEYEDRRKNVVDIESRTNTKAPFGVVSAKFVMKAEVNGNLQEQATIELTLKSVGKDSKSELPDNN